MQNIVVESGCDPEHFHIKLTQDDGEQFPFPECWLVSDLYGINVALTELFDTLKQEGAVNAIRLTDESVANPTLNKVMLGALNELRQHFDTGEIETLDMLLKMDDDMLRPAVQRWREKLIARVQS